MNSDINRVVKDLEETKRYFSSSEYKKMIGKDIVKAIYSRTKSGVGVSSDSRNPVLTGETKLKALSQDYIEQRKKTPKKGELFAPSRSNLTRTGLLLSAISFFTNSTSIVVYIGKKEYPKRRSFGVFGIKLFTINKGGSSKSISTQDVAEYVRKDRPFFALSSKQFGVLIERLNRDFRDRFRRLLK